MHASNYLLLGGLVAALSTSGWADDFRVETDVFVKDEPQPVAETLTLFAGDVVYDFLLSGPREITVFDVRRGRIVLLDQQRKVRTTLTTAELVELSAAIKARADGPDGKPIFATSFVAEVDQEAGSVRLTGGNLEYTAQGTAETRVDEAGRYYVFADWYARLNALRPGNPPPFARLELNRRLAELKRLPREITRTLSLPGKLRAQAREVRSRHVCTWKLSTSDRKRIDDASVFMADFKPVSLANYWQLEQPGQ
jgi:hypothetical protein